MGVGVGEVYVCWPSPRPSVYLESTVAGLKLHLLDLFLHPCLLRDRICSVHRLPDPCHLPLDLPTFLKDLIFKTRR